jgi:hypothetical protein
MITNWLRLEPGPRMPGGMPGNGPRDPDWLGFWLQPEHAQILTKSAKHMFHKRNMRQTLVRHSLLTHGLKKNGKCVCSTRNRCGTQLARNGLAELKAIQFQEESRNGTRKGRKRSTLFISPGGGKEMVRERKGEGKGNASWLGYWLCPDQDLSTWPEHKTWGCLHGLPDSFEIGGSDNSAG